MAAVGVRNARCARARPPAREREDEEDARQELAARAAADAQKEADKRKRQEQDRAALEQMQKDQDAASPRTLSRARPLCACVAATPRVGRRWVGTNNTRRA